MPSPPATVGIVALQGAFREHAEALEAIGLAVCLVRTPQQLAGLDAIVLPGGESTTQDKLLDTSGLRRPLTDALHDGLPCLATCAGLILIASEVIDGRGDQQPLAVLDIAVRRNGYGRQRESFETTLSIGGVPFAGVFIRAPKIERVGAGVEVLAEHDNAAVLVRQGSIWGATFHPELAGDLRLHRQFVATLPSCEVYS